MKKQFFLFCIPFFLLAGCQSIQYTQTLSLTGNKTQQHDSSKESVSSSCDIAPSLRRIEGNSMSPLFHHNDTVFLYDGFYSVCNTLPQKGDLIAYDYAGKKIPVIKKVVADFSHFIQIKNNTLWVDGKEEKNSAGESYSLSDAEQKMITIAVKEGHIPENSYLILGDNINNSIDSRRFGAIGLSNILGKFSMTKK